MNKNIESNQNESNQNESVHFLLFILFLVLFLGVIAGINLPDGVGCSQQNFMCQNFRFKQPKVDY